MSTTALYVELIVIGFQALAWIVLALDSFIPGLLRTTVDSVNSTLLIIAAIIPVYVLGMIFDRVSDEIFSKSETRIRNASGLQAENSLLVEGSTMAHEFLVYTKSKHRILRAASLNIPLITIAAIVHLITHQSARADTIALIGIAGGLLTGLSFWSMRLTLKSFYQKTRLLERNGGSAKRQG